MRKTVNEAKAYERGVHRLTYGFTYSYRVSHVPSTPHTHTGVLRFEVIDVRSIKPYDYEYIFMRIIFPQGKPFLQKFTSE